MRSRTIFGISLSLLIINMAAIMERADENLLPAVYKEVSETFKAGPSDLGYLTFIRNFVQGIASPVAGGIGGGAIATVMAGCEFRGIPGWRFAFVMMATFSIFIAFLVFTFVVDPRKRGSMEHDIAKNSTDREDLIEKGSTNSVSIWIESWTAMKAVMKVQTFQFIVLQGLVGSLPWTAMVFFTLWFELIGFDHNSSATLVSLFAAGCAIGSFFGGVVADRIIRMYPNSGRIMCAQFSAFMGIPFSWFLLRVVPQSVSSYFTFAVTLFLMGLTISWNSTASNGPMFAEVVPSKHRTMIYAFDRAFEVSFSSFAAPIVGILAEKLYGYDTKSVDPVLGSTKEALALSKGLFSMMVLPFGLCCLFYTPLYWTFKKDRENARITSIKETEMI
ncbi:uncharacterized protein LOC132623398 isoform X2 [Lycium barbarum]|uniref:uncharacterized protein LOC132623398 isoform X2 n=1 Tax=Lycium barbarum TaxID=112863 RepID=UPI00293EF51C|nr:uncharacterized protein LOC132623398 isoform X2 [Lycium barbarum]